MCRDRRQRLRCMEFVKSCGHRFHPVPKVYTRHGRGGGSRTVWIGGEQRGGLYWYRGRAMRRTKLVRGEQWGGLARMHRRDATQSPRRGRRSRRRSEGLGVVRPCAALPPYTHPVWNSILIRGGKGSGPSIIRYAQITSAHIRCETEHLPRPDCGRELGRWGPSKMEQPFWDLSGHCEVAHCNSAAFDVMGE